MKINAFLQEYLVVFWHLRLDCFNIGQGDFSVTGESKDALSKRQLLLLGSSHSGQRESAVT